MGARPMSDPVIQSLAARRIWDSRGRPTIEAEITLSDGAMGRGIAPAGASRGSREAIDKRDGGKRLGGLDVQECARRDHKGNRARSHRARSVRPGRDRREAHRPRRDAEQGEARRKRADRRFARPCCTRRRQAAACRSGATVSATSRRSFRCRKSRSSAAALMPDDEPTSRISWSWLRAPKASPRRWRSRRKSIMPRARSWPSAARCRAWPTKAAGGRRSRPTRRRSTRSCARSSAPGSLPGEEAAISLDIAASEFGQGGRYRLGLDQRELDRDALAEMLLRMVRPLSDPVDRGPVRRGRRSRLRALHRRGRRPHPGDRRRLSRHRARTGSARRRGA